MNSNSGGSGLTAASRIAGALPDFWAIHDALCSGVPEGPVVDAFTGGLHWFGVDAAGSLGLAMSPRETLDTPTFAGRVAGMSLRSVAEMSKSWNMADAALGMAAINAHYNAPSRVMSWARDPFCFHQTGENAFRTMLPRVRGRRVAVIGHFRGLDEFARESRLTILERKPMPGDTPDPACEVVLPEADFVFITGTTLINKTLPRLLSLCPQAFVVLVGPTTPPTPLWFDLGVDMIAGLMVDDVPAVWRHVQEGGNHGFFDSGTRMIQIERASAVGKGVA